MKHIPFGLIISRLVIGFICVFLAFSKYEFVNITIVILIITGLLTDVFDGIIARKLNIATEKLRIWDSNVDVIFWLCVIFSVFYLNQNYIIENYILITVILILEIISYIISFIKFKRTIATHSILAKFWTLTLLAFLIDLTLNSTSWYWFYGCIILGIISRLEIITIILALKKWTTDVPSLLSVKNLNKGLPIKKFKLFN
jgi:CDP-diacylglycerol--glycerol-3-phosphate 3-phosphatidyltransferase